MSRRKLFQTPPVPMPKYLIGETIICDRSELDYAKGEGKRAG